MSKSLVEKLLPGTVPKGEFPWRAVRKMLPKPEVILCEISRLHKEKAALVSLLKLSKQVHDNLSKE